MSYGRTRGYAAITSMIVITAIVVVVGVGVALLSIGNAQMSLGSTFAVGARTLGESCLEEVLLKINTTASVPASVVTPQGTCSVTLDSQSGSNYTVSVIATKDGRSKKITASVSRTTTVGITSWQEQN